MSDTESLQALATDLIASLKDRQSRPVEGITDQLHESEPYLPKEQWERLGEALKLAENPTSAAIPGYKWISLRCDGKGFSKLLPKLRRMGILETQGFSERLTSIMQDCCQQALMEPFAAICGYTQSDEMTVLIPPANIINGVQQCHLYNGRVQKLCSMAAATLTAHFNHSLLQLSHKMEKDLEALATFDCRVGAYETKEEAVALILWRAHDSAINGVSDAVYHCGLDGRKKNMKLPTHLKLQWLMQHSLLPLQRHQREGSFFVKRKRVLTSTNPATNETVTFLRSRIEHVPGNLVNLCRDGTMFPPDQRLPGSNEEEKP